MNWILRAAVAALCTVGLLTVAVGAKWAAPEQVGGAKLAFVVSADIIPQHPDFAAAQTQLAKESDALEARKQVMADSMAALVAAYQKDQPTLTPAARTAREDGLNARSDAYNREAQARDDSLTAHSDALVAPMQALLRSVLSDVRNEDGYAFIFDASADNGFIAAVDLNLNITQKVATRFVAQAKAMPRATAPAVTVPPRTGTAPAVAPPASGTTGRPAGAKAP